MSPPPCVCASLALRGRIFSTQAIAWRAPCSSADRRAFVSSRARHAVIRCTQSSRQYPDHTPFAEAVIHRKVGEPPSDEVLELNVENADKVLDEVRPVLQADGGDIEVVSVEDGVITVAMQGSCGSCPSQSATFEMGVDRALKARFGEKLKAVLLAGEVYKGATVEAVDRHLSMLRPAIMNYGGRVEVESLENGVCTLRYKGPAPISRGIQAAIKENFKDINEVVLIDVE